MYVDRYVEWLYGLGLAPRTIAVYRRQFTRYLEFCEAEAVDPAAPTAFEMSKFAVTLPNTHPSRRQVTSVLRHWFDCLGVGDVPALKAIRVPPKKRYMSRALEPEQASALAASSLGWFPEGTATLMGLYLGLRRHEIAMCEWTRFDPDMEWYTVFGKFGVEAMVPVHPVLREELAPRVSIYRYVFPGATKHHVSPTTVGTWVQRAGERAGIERLQPHRLRHTAIATINDETRDLRAAQEFARHADPNTTRIYTRVDRQRLRQAVDSLRYVA